MLMSEEFVYDPQALLDAAEDEEKRRRGTHLNLAVGSPGTYRLVGPYKVVSGLAYWFSSTKRHWQVPVPNESIEQVTFDCSKEIGRRCLTCESKDKYPPAVWENIRPKLRYLFPVIDVNAPEHGVQILEDGYTLWNLFKKMLERAPHLLDPINGENVIIYRYDAKPWREIERVPDGKGRMSLDKIHPEALDWARQENLPDLDAEWKYPTLEEQYTWYGVDTTPVIDVAPEPAAIEGEVVEEVPLHEDTAPISESTEAAQPEEDSSAVIARLREIAKSD
jgi:hypothetical protein